MKCFKNFKYLDELIRSGVSEIVFDCDIVFGVDEFEYKHGIELDADGMVIDGAGHSIDARHNARIFKCNASNVTIRNLKLLNGYVYRDGGGAILNSGDLTIENSAFADNRADNGGAIFNKGDLTIIDSSFARNRAYLGLPDKALWYMMDMPPRGGAIRTKGSLNIIRSTFSKNMAEVDGGAIFVEKGDLNIKQSCFSENSVYSEGGAIFKTGGNSSVEKSIFSKNHAFDGGGAIINFKGELCVVDSTFIHNFSSEDGGAISNEVSLKVEDSRFIENSAHGIGSFGRGGAIYNFFSGNSIIRRSFFRKNTAKAGGAIYQAERLSITDSVFVENTADDNGGAVGVNDARKFTLNNCTFRENKPDDVS